MATQSEVGRHLSLSQPEVSTLVGAGFFQQSGRGGLNLDECRAAYIKKLREAAAGREENSLNLTAERARLAKEGADRIALANASRRRELVPIDGAVQLIGEACSTVRSKLLALPSSAAPMLLRCRTAPEMQAQLYDLVWEALDSLCRETLEGKMSEQGPEDGKDTAEVAAIMEENDENDDIIGTETRRSRGRGKNAQAVSRHSGGSKARG